MATNNDIPASFVVVYYNNFVYEPSKLIQFYDENAKIWRQSMSSNEGQGINETKSLLTPEIPIGTDFRVLSFQSCPFENGYSLFVTASLDFEGNTKVLNQSFVLQMKYDRWFIISDILNINNLSSVLPTNIETTAVKSNVAKANTNTNNNQNYQQHPNTKKPKQNDPFKFSYTNP